MYKHGYIYLTVSFTSGGSRSARSKNRPSTSNWQTISHKISTGRHSVWRFSMMISAPSFQGTDHFIFMGICFFETKWHGCEFFMKIIWLCCTWTKFCPKHFSIKVSGRLIDWLVVSNSIFNTQWLYIWWSVLVEEWSEWSTDRRRVIDKLYRIKYERRCITVTF